ncbi:MAG: AI-2E family transporter [Candidatus Magnetomorum sp.]|nr:AI-2E family transporter [Candidatus Magnetomorum sp.]
MNDNPSINIQSQYFLFFLLFVVLFGCYCIIQPYIHAIILAIIFSIVFIPIHRKVERLLKGRKNVAAIISCALLTLVVVLPIMFLLIALIQQGVSSINAIYDWVAAAKYEALMQSPLMISFLAFWEKVVANLKMFFPRMDLEALSIKTDMIQFDKILLSMSTYTAQFLLNQGTFLLGNLTAILGKFFLMIFTFFFIVRDYDEIVAQIFHLIPLSSSQENRLINRVREVSKSAILGTLVTAVAQGTAGGITFWLAGLPGLFWGSIMAFASLVPMFGTALIWVPAAFYLLLSGHWMSALFVTLSCAIIVGMIDNFVRPVFMQGSSDMSTLLIFFSILGGMQFFGLIGLLYGPLIFGLTLVLLYIYSIEFEAFLKYQDEH